MLQYNGSEVFTNIMKAFINKAEHTMKCASHHHSMTKISESSPKWKSLQNKLKEAVKSNVKNDEVSFLKRYSLLNKPLKELCETSKNLNRIILNLFPLNNGYSLMFKMGGDYYSEAISLPYEEYEILDYIDNEEIPPLLVSTLENLKVEIFYSGCVIAEIRDYRIAAGPNTFQTKYTLLHPSQQTLFGDVNDVVESTSHLYQWNNDDRLALESCMILSTSAPLCLDPTPTVAVLNNIAHQRKRPFSSTPFKRLIRRHGLLAQRRVQERRKRTAPPSLRLFDFVQQRNTKKAKQSPSSSADIRLPHNVVDLWPKESPNHQYPSSGIGVHECAKPLSPHPPHLSDDLIEVQQIHLKSESQTRDVYSRITILQRPSDMHYFGKLQSNKYFQQHTAEKGAAVANSCSRFALGTEHRANLYILQYQELFAEDGRRPATVAVSRPLQQTTKYQIPLLQQPWQLEQDRALYAVGSINNLPVKHWTKFKANDNFHRAQVAQQNAQVRQQQKQQQQLQQQQQQQQQHQQQKGLQSSTGPTQISIVTTPTLNTITLQSGSQSAFMFPMPRHQLQQQQTQQQQTVTLGQNQQTMSIGQPHQTLHSTSTAPTLSRVLGHRLSTETLLLQGSGQDNNSRLAVVTQQSKQQQLNQAGVQQGTNVVNQAKLSSFLTESGQKLSNVMHAVDGTKNINQQSGGVSLQLPLTMTIATQQHEGGKLHISNAGAQQQHMPGATIVRVPASITSASAANQQQTTTLNLLSGGRSVQNTSQSFQQIQLTSGSRLSSSGTVTIPANIAVQLAAQFNQQQQQSDKLTGSGISHQQVTLCNTGTSSPITIISKDGTTGLSTMQQQTQHRTIGVTRSTPQLIQHLDGHKSTTITINPRAQMFNLRAGNGGHQPVQILQGNVQQLPVRSQGQQILLNTVIPVNSDPSKVTGIKKT